ncbi:hypothetical protein COLO4_33325 [Corchorus olitorius]|uniref:Uncharacterized protein n=1 Tax=Corchorus olitorius TaxID=93759 RepID=A0A1R3GUX5_9ROSI|nr:hypothetical protein COLO4_33325 [Corchorus olitorius]
MADLIDAARQEEVVAAEMEEVLAAQLEKVVAAAMAYELVVLLIAFPELVAVEMTRMKHHVQLLLIPPVVDGGIYGSGCCGVPRPITTGCGGG